MHIEYETNLDNIVDAYYRYHERSAASRKMRYVATFWAGSMTGVVVFLMFSLVGLPLLARFILAVLGIVVAAGGYSLDYPRSMKRRIYKLLREQIPSEPILFSVELRDEDVLTKQGGTQVSYEWSNVKEVVDLKEVVELRMHDGGFVSVCNKGFPDEESRRKFIEIANQRIQSKSS